MSIEHDKRMKELKEFMNAELKPMQDNLAATYERLNDALRINLACKCNDNCICTPTKSPKKKRAKRKDSS